MKGIPNSTGGGGSQESSLDALGEENEMDRTPQHLE